MQAGRIERALFVADIHLSPDEPATVERFLAFLAGPARAAASLTILGDLFEYWAGDDDLADPFNARIVGALRTLADSGTTVAFMAGNRDFLIGDAFAAAAGVSLLSDSCVRDIGGIKTLLTHGDTLCTDDADYQQFRRQVRDPAWQAQFLSRPLAERKAEIAELRRRSESEKKIKPLAIMDVNPAAVAAALRTHGAQALIHGHTHRQGTHQLANHRQRWVLGDWRPERGSVLACDAAGWRFID